MINSQIIEHKQFMRRIFETTTVAEAERTGVVAELYEIERRLNAWQRNSPPNPPRITSEFQNKIQEHDCHASSEDGCKCEPKKEYSEEYPHGDYVTEPYDIQENR